MFSVDPYLARVGYTGPTAPTLETLRALHRAHLLAVPFENLDISLGREIVVDEAAIIRKVVEQRRGGFCYELNSAFAALLRALGFRVTLLSVRVARERGGEGPEFDHLTLQVDLRDAQEGTWLANVGFGESFLEPLRLQPAVEQVDPAGTFRLERLPMQPPTQTEERLQLEKAEPGGHWKRQYSFSLQPRHLADFATMCRYHQTSPESSFTQSRICTRATPDGRITLSGMKLIVTRNGQREENALASEKEAQDALQRYFGVRL